MIRKKLVVCGCSYSSVSYKKEHIGTSWSEILSKKLDFDLINLARSGCSNGAIRLQINEVLKIKPDFAIITPTSYDRIELPNFEIESKFGINFKNLKKVRELIKFDINLDKLRYNKKEGLEYNINYGHNDSRLISEPLLTLIYNTQHMLRKPIPQEIINALQLYVNYLYDPRWKQQIDEWIISSGLFELKANNIPFLVNPGLRLWESVDEMKDALQNLISDNYLLDSNEKNPYHIFLKFPAEDVFGPDEPGYHTSYEGQELIANGFYNLIKQRWNL